MSVSVLTLLAAFLASPQASPHLKPCESIPPRFVLVFSLSRYRLQSLLALSCLVGTILRLLGIFVRLLGIFVRLLGIIISLLVIVCNVLELVDNFGFLISFFFDKFIC